LASRRAVGDDTATRGASNLVARARRR